ncbi:hypothetical protein NDU88_002468 [Pleurodeles waltl]|uniref:Uncharacterized protein n=1 Tax=Pleurodeles waltl TaxID=8319 RepID=A0AAV7LE67_PLEWA|nr:hypothetical protein NDU88_002468 [Pleurodeles waltl]
MRLSELCHLGPESAKRRARPSPVGQPRAAKEEGSAWGPDGVPQESEGRYPGLGLFGRQRQRGRMWLELAAGSGLRPDDGEGADGWVPAQRRWWWRPRTAAPNSGGEWGPAVL